MGGQFLRPISQELCYIKVPWKSWLSTVYT
jgi:hypothetical protein